VHRKKLMEKLSYENILTNITLHQIDSTSLHLLFQRNFTLLASCNRFSCYYRFSDIVINSVNPSMSFIWRLEFSKNFSNILLFYLDVVWFGRWPEPWNFKTSHFRILYSFPSRISALFLFATETDDAILLSTKVAR
jgi:hypothetical protein